MHFQRVLDFCDIQTVLSRISTQEAEYTSYDDNRYTSSPFYLDKRLKYFDQTFQEERNFFHAF